MNLERIIAVRTSKAVYRDGNKAVKVFDQDYTKADVLNEALNQSRIEETGLSIPKILSVTIIEGKWTIISEHIKGKTLSSLMEENPDKYHEYLELFVDLQMEVHSKAVPLLNKLRDKMIREISESDLDAIVRYDLHTRLKAMAKDNKLCHGDFNPSNIIISEEGTPYILDWSHATQGNASADVARTYFLFWLSGDTDGAEKYLDLFCKKSGIEKDYVREWLPIVAASQSVKGKAKDREALLSWIKGEG